MSTVAAWLGARGPGLADHLWQTTAFVVLVWIATLALRRHGAGVRYGLWLAASVKFLLPFWLLVAAGGLLPRPQRVGVPAVSLAVEAAGEPFTTSQANGNVPVARVMSLHDRALKVLPATVGGVWIFGFGAVAVVWAMRWKRAVKTRRRAAEARDGRELDALRLVERRMGWRSLPVRLLLSGEVMEPGVFGILRPALVWPVGLTERLDPEQMEAILAHELAHVRRQDNLAALVHMAVEALFWFHPAVWWVERRLVEERERACDEVVVALGSRPGAYAEGLVRACRFCVESRVMCVAGISGADLAKRVRAVMTMRMERLGRVGRCALATLGVAAVVGPLAFGVVRMLPVYGQILHAEGALPSFEVATIRPWRRPAPPPMVNGEPVIHQEVAKVSPGSGGAQKSDRVHIIIPALELIGSAYGLPPDSGRRIVGGPAWLREDGDQYEIDAKIEDAEFAGMRGMTPEQQHRRVQLMEQSLLAERFGLKVHFETRELPVFGLVVAKGGPKLEAAKAEERSRISTVVKEQTRELTGTAVTMAEFVGSPLMRGPAGGRPVADETGLKGAYDFVLRWSVEDAGPVSAAVDGPAFSTALEEQLGLKLVAAKAPVEVIVIDHVEKPKLPDSGAGQGASAMPTALPAAGPLPSATQPLRPVAVAVEKDSYEVATVKPSDPTNLGSGFRVRGRELESVNTSVGELIAFSYELQENQIRNGPAWMDKEHFDVTLLHRGEAVPSDRECKAMIREVLAERFGLRVHPGEDRMRAYLLLPGKKTAKLTKSEGDPNGLPGLHFSAPGALMARNATMRDFVGTLQRALNRPVIDRTELPGRWDFALNWKPDETQFGGRGRDLGNDDDLPGLSAAVEEQLGLQLTATVTSAATLVIDRLERPSEN